MGPSPQERIHAWQCKKANCCLECQKGEARPYDDLSQVTDPENVNDQALKLALQFPGSVSHCGLEDGAAELVTVAEGKGQ